MTIQICIPVSSFVDCSSTTLGNISFATQCSTVLCDTLKSPAVCVKG